MLVYFLGVLENSCHFCKLKKRNETCEKNLILRRRWRGCKMAKASPENMAS